MIAVDLLGAMDDQSEERDELPTTKISG